MIERFKVFTGTAKEVQQKVREYLEGHPNAKILGTAIHPGKAEPVAKTPKETTEEPAKKQGKPKPPEPIVAISVGIVTG